MQSQVVWTTYIYKHRNSRLPIGEKNQQIHLFMGYVMYNLKTLPIVKTENRIVKSKLYMLCNFGKQKLRGS